MPSEAQPEELASPARSNLSELYLGPTFLMRLPQITLRFFRTQSGIASAALVIVLCLPLAAQDLAQATAGGRPLEGGGPADVTRLADEANLIVRGIVSGGEPRWVGKVIYTHYDVVVQETLKGQAESSVTIAVPGGALGNVALSIPGAPTLSAGQEIVFFGKALGKQSSTFGAVGLFDGIVPISATAAGGSTVRVRGHAEKLDGFLDEIRRLGRRSPSGRGERP